MKPIIFMVSFLLVMVGTVLFVSYNLELVKGMFDRWGFWSLLILSGVPTTIMAIILYLLERRK